MSVVDVDRSKPWTKETGFAILATLGLGEKELCKLMPPEAYGEYKVGKKESRERRITSLELELTKEERQI